MIFYHKKKAPGGAKTIPRTVGLCQARGGKHIFHVMLNCDDIRVPKASFMKIDYFSGKTQVLTIFYKFPEKNQ